jgi:hypothetical protein
MIEGRVVFDRSWDVFQHGKYNGQLGWFYTDANSVIRGPYATEQFAMNACHNMKKKGIDSGKESS